MKLKKFWTGIALAMGVVGLTGCGSQSKDIVLWNPFTGNDGTYFQKMVDSYNKTNPEVKIKSVTTPDMYTKINTVMNSKKDKDIPDLTIIHAEKVELFEAQGLLQNMDTVLKEQPNIKSENYIEQAWKSGEMKGKRYTVPLDVHTVALYYNKKLLTKYSPHALDDGAITWDEIEAMIPKAKADGIIVYPISEEVRTLLALVTEQGGQVEVDGKPQVNTPEFKKALELYRKLVKAGGTQEDGDDQSQLFQSGKAIFNQSGTWDVGVLSDSKDLDWGMTNTPAWEKGKTVNWTSSHQFGLLKKERSAEKMKGIGKFLEYVRKHSDVWADSGQNVASQTVFSEASYQKRPQAFLTSTPAELATLKIYDFKDNGTMIDALTTQVRDVIYGRKSIDAGLTKAQKEINDKSKDGDGK